MASIDEMIRSYVATWNESDPAKREQIIEKTWSSDGIYRNAAAEFDGYNGIARAVTAAHDSFVANGCPRGWSSRNRRSSDSRVLRLMLLPPTRLTVRAQTGSPRSPRGDGGPAAPARTPRQPTPAPRRPRWPGRIH
jgi:hypothetical protein